MLNYRADSLLFKLFNLFINLKSNTTKDQRIVEMYILHSMKYILDYLTS